VVLRISELVIKLYYEKKIPRIVEKKEKRNASIGVFWKSEGVSIYR